MKERKGQRVRQIIYIAVFFIVLLLPVLLMNREPGRVSAIENRYLAPFPEIIGSDGKLAPNIRGGFEAWLGDNLGFRDDLMRLASRFKLKVMNQSVSEKVELGRDGWYFYAQDHNVDIAAGRFSLSEEQLQKIAENQRRISDWYASRGVPYILVLVPGKPSVYPEYIAWGDFSVQDTLCDQLEAYLRENTDVCVLNTKPALVESKGEGKLYLQHDTHLTQLGAYHVFRSVAERLDELGFPTRDFSVTFGETEQGTGDLALMLGSLYMLGPETVPVASWDARARLVTDGALVDALRPYKEADPEADVLGCAVVDDPAAENGTLMIYCDSQWEAERNMPQLLGESFQTVVAMGYRNVNVALDAVVEPDVVVFACGERQMLDVLMREPGVPAVS